MGRPVASSVSALSGFVANGHQTLHHVSSPPSKIPYGGFSPVRLQTEIRPRPSPHQPPRLIRGPSWPEPTTQVHPSVWVLGSVTSSLSVQRSLARRRVILSRQVIAYYDLIRGSGPLPPISDLCRYTAGLRRKAKAHSVPNLLCASFLPCRLPYPGGRAVSDCSQSARTGLRHVRSGSAPAIPTQKSVHAWLTISRQQSSLHATARKFARPTPTRAFTFELSFH